MHELVQKMQPGVTMLCLHGAMSHKKRLQMCNAFNNKKYAYLIATDVAARGLGRCGVVRCGVAWCGVTWCDVVWRSLALCGVVWRGGVWNGGL